MHDRNLGPDLVIAGAARSGTSSLAAQLATHPDIDGGSIKESNYFSRGLDRGPEWYDSLYADRRTGLLRMDASTSYTSPFYPQALQRLAAAAPGALIVYAVRRPTKRAVSQYLYRHHHFFNEPAGDFGAALEPDSLYIGAGDYARWLRELHTHFPAEQILLVPFEVITQTPQAATDEICRQLSLSPLPPADGAAHRHRNNVVEYRHDLARRAARMLRRSDLYPRLRSILGAGPMRRARSLVTRQARLPTAEEAMASCTPDQLKLLGRLDHRAGVAVREHLLAQDSRLGLAWACRSFAHEPV